MAASPTKQQLENLADIQEVVCYLGEQVEAFPSDRTFVMALEYVWAMLLDFCDENGLQHCFEDTTNEYGNRPALVGEIEQMRMF